MIPMSGERLPAWVCFFLACTACRAFIPPTVVGFHGCRTHSVTFPRQRCSFSRSRTTSKIVSRMQIASEEKLQIAVETLAGEVDELTTIVNKLAKDTTAAVPGVGDQTLLQEATPVAEEKGTALSVATSASPVRKKIAGPTELVCTENAQQRIDHRLKEQGQPVSTSEGGAQVADQQVAAAASAASVPEEVPAAEGSAETPYKVKIEWDGATHDITCDADTTVLDAAMEAGIDLPSSCMAGSCLTCPGQLISGSVDQSDGVLEDDQTEAGYMLTCVSYPLSDLHFKVIEEEDIQ